MPGLDVSGTKLKTTTQSQYCARRWPESAERRKFIVVDNFGTDTVPVRFFAPTGVVITVTASRFADDTLAELRSGRVFAHPTDTYQTDAWGIGMSKRTLRHYDSPGVH